MTTFTTDDREEEYKKILKAAPNQPGYEDAVPIPHNGLASKELTDHDIIGLWKPSPDTKVYVRDLLAFARAILKKAKEK
jgi:hypothetical protein